MKIKLEERFTKDIYLQSHTDLFPMINQSPFRQASKEYGRTSANISEHDS